MTLRIRIAWLLLSLTALGCSPEIHLPPAQALSATPEQLQAIENRTLGAHAVNVIAKHDWQANGRSLQLRVVRPTAKGPWPLVLFSHGFASDTDQYDALLKHWASHGYLSIAPYHRDGGGTLRAIFNSLRYGKDGLIQQRLEDFQLILAHLDQLDAIQPGLSAAIDRKNIIAAGHSFGAFSAQQLGGAMAIDPDSDLRIGGRDSRVKAVVAVSPPGEMFGLINAASWHSMAVPMLVTTGTWDMDGRFVTQWQQHALSYDTAPAGDNWLLVSQGADHYLGHLICRLERDVPAQTDALTMLNAVSVSFLNATRDQRLNTTALLNSDLLEQTTQGFSQLQRR